MACMCGDLYCWSCGPAQGNSKCHVCGKWSMDGGCDNSEQCNAIAQERDRLEAEQYEEMERAANEYVAQQRQERKEREKHWYKD